MNPYVDIEALNQQIYIESQFVERLNTETHKVIVGQTLNDRALNDRFTHAGSYFAGRFTGFG